MNSKNIAITIIIALVVGGAGFYGGTIYKKNSLTSQGLLRNASGARQFGQGQNDLGQSGGQRGAGLVRGGNGGGFATGEIIAKDDKSLTVKMPDGSSKIIFFSDSTTVGKATQGSANDLANGEQVVVNGQANPDGSLNAQNIQIRPAE